MSSDGLPHQVTSDGRAIRPGTDTLAGTVLPLDECMRRFRKFTGCSLVEALEAASLHPAQAIGIENRKGTLEVGDCS
jgi:N-acetylglucosamine-6-phosphate deacetylase